MIDFKEIEKRLREYEEMPLPSRRLLLKSHAKQLTILLVDGTAESPDTRRLAGSLLLDIVKQI